jgi:F0F1-type ATP synthase membrane subunit b/b'
MSFRIRGRGCRDFALSLALPAFALTACDAAFAAGGEHAEVSLLWPTLNFFIYLAILGYCIRRLVNPALRARAAEVDDLLQRAARDIAAAAEELGLRQERRRGIAQEQQLIRERLEQDGERIAREVLKNGEHAAAAVRADVGKKVERELKKAAAEVRQQVVEGAAKRARDVLRRSLAPDDDRRLRQEAINGLFE